MALQYRENELRARQADMAKTRSQMQSFEDKLKSESISMLKLQRAELEKEKKAMRTQAIMDQRLAEDEAMANLQALLAERERAHHAEMAAADEAKRAELESELALHTQQQTLKVQRELEQMKAEAEVEQQQLFKKIETECAEREQAMQMELAARQKMFEREAAEMEEARLRAKTEGEAAVMQVQAQMEARRQEMAQVMEQDTSMFTDAQAASGSIASLRIAAAELALESEHGVELMDEVKDISRGLAGVQQLVKLAADGKISVEAAKQQIGPRQIELKKKINELMKKHGNADNARRLQRVAKQVFDEVDNINFENMIASVRQNLRKVQRNRALTGIDIMRRE